MKILEVMSPSNTIVIMNYLVPEVCGLGPFRWIRLHRPAIEKVIKVNELVQLMSPPLQYKERRYLFIIFTVYFIQLLIWGVVSMLFTVINTGLSTAVLYWSCVGWLFGALFLNLGVSSYYGLKFRHKVLAHVDELNNGVLLTKGLEFYYPNDICRRKNLNRLGIRKCEVTQETVIREIIY